MATKRTAAQRKQQLPLVRKSNLSRQVCDAAGDGNVPALTIGMQSYYMFALEQALANIQQARMLVSGNIVETNHELPTIERLIAEALDAS